MNKTFFRLAFTASLFVALVGACGSPASVTQNAPATVTAAPQKPFRVALILPSASNDFAFSQSMYDALLRIQAEMGGPEKMELVYSQGMGIVADADAAIRIYAGQGYDLVIANGSQYGPALKEIASEFPQTSFAWGTTADTFGLKNVFAYSAASQEGGYVNGVLAASLTNSKKIGVIGPLELGDAKLYINGFKAGVAATNPEIVVDVNYIGSFSDVVTASGAATTYLAAGADVLTGTAQMVVGPIEIAKKRGTPWLGTQSNQTSLAPSIVVANQVYHWEVVLKQIIAKIQAGQLGGESFTINLANGGEVIEYNPDYALPAAIKLLGEQTARDIASGVIKVSLP